MTHQANIQTLYIFLSVVPEYCIWLWNVSIISWRKQTKALSRVGAVSCICWGNMKSVTTETQVKLLKCFDSYPQLRCSKCEAEKLIFFFCIQGSIEKEWVHLTVFACPRSMSSDHWKHSMPPSVKGVYKSSISNSVERRENTEAVRWLPRDKITVSCVVWCLQISSNSLNLKIFNLQRNI